MYNLYLDDPRSIKCEVEIEGADASNSKARLMIETKNRCLYFNGTVKGNGEVEIPINMLKGVLGENVKGTMLIELVVDDMLFTPWKSEFVTKVKRQVALNIKEGLDKTVSQSNRPGVKLKMKTFSDREHADSLFNLLKEYRIPFNKLGANKDKLKAVVNAYVRKHKLTEASAQNVQKYLITNIVKVIK